MLSPYHVITFDIDFIRPDKIHRIFFVDDHHFYVIIMQQVFTYLSLMQHVGRKYANPVFFHLQEICRIKINPAQGETTNFSPNITEKTYGLHLEI